MAAASFIERREDLRGGFMLCFLDDGAGMDPSKWLYDDCFVEHNNLLLKFFCDLTVVARGSTWGMKSLLQHLSLITLCVCRVLS